MQSGFGHRIVWNTVMNVLEDHSVSTFTGRQEMEAIFPDRKLSTYQSDCTVP